jgi:hypothetical protein
MRTRSIVLAAAVALGAARSAQAQHEPPTREPTRWYVGGDITVGQPRGAFADNVSTGYGVSGHAIYRLDEAGLVGIRVDGGALIYGNEHQSVPFGGDVGGRVRLDMNTSNNIGFLGIGPQIGVPTGRLRPYVNGYAGVSYFFTDTSLRGSGSSEEFARTTNYHDATFSYGGGAGLYVPVRRGPSPISIDLGVRYHDNGRARYLREGDITDNSDDTITVHPRETDTDLLTFHFGVSVGISR